MIRILVVLIMDKKWKIYGKTRSEIQNGSKIFR